MRGGRVERVQRCALHVDRLHPSAADPDCAATARRRRPLQEVRLCCKRIAFHMHATAGLWFHMHATAGLWFHMLATAGLWFEPAGTAARSAQSTAQRHSKSSAMCCHRMRTRVRGATAHQLRRARRDRSTAAPRACLRRRTGGTRTRRLARAEAPASQRCARGARACAGTRRWRRESAEEQGAAGVRGWQMRWHARSEALVAAERLQQSCQRSSRWRARAAGGGGLLSCFPQQISGSSWRAGTRRPVLAACAVRTHLDENAGVDHQTRAAC